MMRVLAPFLTGALFVLLVWAALPAEPQTETPEETHNAP
jgi:hypothetical protein